MHVLHVVGARPNFMKAAPVMTALSQCNGVRQTLVHTGQHYDENMSRVFFQELGLPNPDIDLGVGSDTHTVQTAQIMMRFEAVALAQRPDLVLVYGDVNSTVAAALVCAKLGVPVGHVEAGLRSFDRTMPEEINRLLTDQIADLLFTPSADGDENLLREGVAAEKIHRVGNVMIDTLVRLLPKAENRPILAELGLAEDGEWKGENGKGISEIREYVLVTLHRPSNVDEPAMLREIMEALDKISHDIPVIFPVHPRTRQRLLVLRSPLSMTKGPVEVEETQYPIPNTQLRLIKPLGYLDFLALQRHATLVITDSGGIQEETTYLGVPCLTVRENTERPVTVTLGTNILVGQNMERLRAEVGRILAGDGKQRQVPPLWDGHAAERIANIISLLPPQSWGGPRGGMRMETRCR